ncbi:filamentous hemagglutinin N-terminal domain-containing protein, partial [Salmonella enterica subsp. enterica serovar Virchow]|nr:filamentous hemagglutinin N-terminal domain-containing protein [Salmonella enterica subsp. enterica serovar Java]EBV8394651.1 filamentous hemagglutinin N-terminal domain-containing protein [Salmonella enterica subsp. enterica serovar Virchow]
MNKIYRLKFNKCRNELVAVSEITAGTGKEKNTGHIAGLCDVSTFRKLVGTLTPLAFLTGLIISLFPVVALANPDLPTGGQIVGGQGSISTSGNQMTIHQQTQNMATNWHSFDIGQNNTVQFVQPDSSSVALNRVTGASGSQIMGTLKANGQVFILNPNGVLFGKNARVNVAGLVASTKNINTADFMKGQYTLSGEGNPGAQVVNQGSLTTTKGGYIVLAADQVKNSGTITTPSGKTVLAAGKTVTLQLDNGGLTSVSVDGSVVNALVDNRGLISATNGQVFLTARGKDMLLNTVVNNSGTIEAKGLESRGGEIVLNGGSSGVVNQAGQLLADSHAGPGGKITVEGQNIHLAANSRTSATGKTGGGEVYVGGGWQGKDSHIRNASKVVMDKTATVDVSATDAGSGGTAVLWSDDYTNFRGAILAKGGALSGDGGRVETSSHNNLQAFGDVDTSASAGHGGEWLLDPLDVTIVSGDANTGVTESGKGAGGATLDTGTDHVFSPSASGAQVSAQKISDQLNNGTSVTVETHGDGSQAGNITFNKDASVKKTAGGDATLTLKADRGISFEKRDWIRPGDTGNGAIVSTHGELNLNLLTGNDGKNGTVGFKGFVRLHLNGGDAFIGPANTTSGNASVSFQNDDTIDAGNITLNTAGGVTGNNYGLNADKNLTVNGPLSLGVNSGVTSELKAGGLLKITA